MPLAQEKRRRGQVEPGFCAGDRQQSIQILVARPRELDHLAIHYLLAGQTNLAEQPPDRGMEPEAGSALMLKSEGQGKLRQSVSITTWSTSVPLVPAVRTTDSDAGQVASRQIVCATPP